MLNRSQARSSLSKARGFGLGAVAQGNGRQGHPGLLPRKTMLERGGLWRLVLALVAAALLVACGRAERLGSIPNPPSDATELPADVLPFDRTATIESLKTTMEVGTVDIRVYLVPLATTFAQLESYYQSYLQTGWKSQETPALTTARSQGREAALWSNARTGEIFSVQYVSAPGYDGNLLIVLYAGNE